jgi:GH15 family glucan-1,4-alpha-glucosidase
MSSLDLAVIGNCTSAALIDRRAQVVWGCIPRFDGDPAFCALLDGDEVGNGTTARRGVFAIELEGMTTCEQHYHKHTAVLVSTLSDDHGNAVEITDFAPRFRHYDRVFRQPGLVRRVRPVSGRPRIRIRLRPLFEWGDVQPQVTRGSNHMRFVGPSDALRLTTDASISYVAEERFFALDRTISFIFGPDEPLRAAIDDTARDFLERTIAYWEGWVRSLSIPFEWQADVIRAAITLKLCSFQETGAVVAALTTSIPEAPHTQRNWDYRFCWLRDAYFVVHALNRLGTTRTMEGFLAFITNVVEDSEDTSLAPLFGITRASRLEEREAKALSGYRGMGPVRVGNAAYTQQQNDVYGSVILASTHIFFDSRLHREGMRGLFEQLEKLGERAAEVFDTPDAGPWELRTKAAVHTFSAVMCWAACDRLARIATQIGMQDRAEYWREKASHLHERICERIWNDEKGHFVSTFDGTELDATLLLLAELNFVRPDDARFVATVEAIDAGLRRGNLVKRYAVEDDFGVMETGFLICSFWFVDALDAIGRREEARAMFDEVLKLRNSFGLLSEDADFESGSLWGNFPQTYSMVGLINSAVRLSRTWEEAF